MQLLYLLRQLYMPMHVAKIIMCACYISMHTKNLHTCAYVIFIYGLEGKIETKIISVGLLCMHIVHNSSDLWSSCNFWIFSACAL